MSYARFVQLKPPPISSTSFFVKSFQRILGLPKGLLPTGFRSIAARINGFRLLQAWPAHRSLLLLTTFNVSGQLLNMLPTVYSIFVTALRLICLRLGRTNSATLSLFKDNESIFVDFSKRGHVSDPYTLQPVASGTKTVAGEALQRYHLPFHPGPHRSWLFQALYLHRIKRSPDGGCFCCFHPRDTAEHTLLLCPH